jgi:antitoxin VapB
MQTAKLFTNGRSQAVRLPKEYRLDGTDVFITSLDGVIMLIPRKTPWAGFVASLKRFTGDFMEERKQPELEQRAF